MFTLTDSFGIFAAAFIHPFSNIVYLFFEQKRSSLTFGASSFGLQGTPEGLSSMVRSGSLRVSLSPAGSVLLMKEEEQSVM
jgi:hypothetical protein